jgi:uncharacterized integral membrane protein
MKEGIAMKLRFSQVVGAIIILIVLIFALANLTSVQVNVLFTQIKAPLFLVIILSLLLGMLAQFLLSLFKRSPQK